jgi:hypothetical protein
VEILAATTEDEVATTFARAELQSPRFRDEVLAGTRGWRIGGLFDGLPEDIDWSRVALEPAEVLALRYIDWDWWLRISDGTRSAVVAAERIRAGLVPGADADSERPLAARLRSDDPPPELIAVTTDLSAPPVLVEGHVRLTAYALHPEFLPPRLEILLGISPRVREWSEY